MRSPRYSVKRTESLVPLVPGLYKFRWIMRSLAFLSRKVIHHCWSTQQYNSTDMHSAGLWSAFLASVQQGRALECAFVVLNSTGMHCHTYLRSLQNTDASIIQPCNGGPMMSTIEGFHCEMKALDKVTTCLSSQKNLLSHGDRYRQYPLTIGCYNALPFSVSWRVNLTWVVL